MVGCGGGSKGQMVTLWLGMGVMLGFGVFCLILTVVIISKNGNPDASRALYHYFLLRLNLSKILSPNPAQSIPAYLRVQEASVHHMAAYNYRNYLDFIDWKMFEIMYGGNANQQMLLHLFNLGCQIRGYPSAPICDACQQGFTNSSKIAYLDECKHVFHRECLRSHLSSHLTCPHCKKNILRNNFLIRELKSYIQQSTPPHSNTHIKKD